MGSPVAQMKIPGLLPSLSIQALGKLLPQRAFGVGPRKSHLSPLQIAVDSEAPTTQSECEAVGGHLASFLSYSCLTRPRCLHSPSAPPSSAARSANMSSSLDSLEVERRGMRRFSRRLLLRWLTTTFLLIVIFENEELVPLHDGSDWGSPQLRTIVLAFEAFLEATKDLPADSPLAASSRECRSLTMSMSRPFELTPFLLCQTSRKVNNVQGFLVPFGRTTR